MWPGVLLPALPIPRVVEEHEALAERCHASARVGFRLGIGTILGQTDALLEASTALAKSMGKGIHTHLAEVREEKTAAQLRWGKSTVLRAEEVGILGAGCVAGHGIWVSRAEMETLAKANAAIIYNPTANMILASGVCPLGAHASSGVSLGIGTDGAASNDSHNMIEVLKLGALLQKVHWLDPEAADARTLLKLATIEGARALGLHSITGSLEPGKRADVVRFDGHSFGAAIVHDPYQQIVYGAGPESVADVWVDGRRLLANGKFEVFDPRSIVPQVREAARATGQGCQPFGIFMPRTVIIGAGHNGLVCAAYLAAAKHDVTVIERAPVPGGCCFTEEILPGYRINPGALELEGMVHSGIDRELNLRDHGLRWLRTAHLLAAHIGDRTALFHRDLSATLDGFRQQLRRRKSRTSGPSSPRSQIRSCPQWAPCST